ncbi:hypothetical protein EDD18DRAFT_1111574 [Armillaria luteobubalina]|uniref:Uncharacterized protein n=1 Tax=Armillaria luteobubalina TaxID=153913 RepID=A0AA39UMZ6_9AGAR|nr:hypothetical protein EDD18DRAFT_1111574 [Armillaria luteobubalina]
MEQQGPSSTPALLTTSPDTTLAPVELTVSQILDYFWMPDGLLDTPRFIKSYQTLNKTLRATQLQVTKLVEKNRLLEMSLPARSKKGHANSLTQEQSSDIRHYAQRCVSTVDPWVDDANIFQSHESVNNKLILSPERYESPESEEQGIYAEVYAVLNEEHHFFFKKNYGPAVKKFIKSASDGCSTCISRIKNEAFHSIFGSLLPPSAAVKGFDPFTDPHCQELLGYDPQKKVYSTLPPILWPNTVKDSGNNQYLFRSEILMNILLAIFFSAMSIKEKTVTKKKLTHAVLWKVEQITPGTIAFAAIVARYVLSGNEHFDKRGGHSHIPYAADFKFYKTMIIQNLNKSHMVETIAAFNRYLFEGQGTNRSGNQSRSDEYETIDISNDFTDSSGSDDEPLDVQLTEETMGHDSKLASAPTADVAVDELVGSVAGVTLGTALLEIEPTATDSENQSQNDPMETGGLVRSEGNK